MKKLILMRGIPGSGKSTFISKMGLEGYTLSTDSFRLEYKAPELTENGVFLTSSDNERQIWKHTLSLLEERMKRGDFTIIDATHTRTRDFTNYKKLVDEYRYDVICVDFSHVPFEQAVSQNAKRAAHKQLPLKSLERMHERIQQSGIPNWVNVVHPDDFKQSITIKPADFSHYKKIHVIGDVHGCYQALKGYMPETLPHDELFIFVGDYVDRGIENGDVMNYLFTFMHRSNIIFLEGNHEIHLWKYANDLPSYSKREFERYTKPDLDKHSISKKTLRSFYRRLKDFVYFTYNDKEVLVTHGGLSTIPRDLIFVSSEQLIKGVGEYSTEIDRIFTENTASHMYQIHGHRNIHEFPVEASPRSFNLEGKVEFGGHLRIVTLDQHGFTPIELKNNVINKRFTLNEIKRTFDNHAFMQSLRSNKLIAEKNLGKHVSSFNFKREVFYDSLWNAQNVKARGMFINTETTEIVARSYDKSFNIESYLNEEDDTLF